MTRYDAFIKIIETGSFTKAAEELGYTQSAISQMIHSLEKELSTTLILRSRKGISLTPDGQEILPYIKNIYYAHRELIEKHKEMQGLQSGIIRIGTFSSVSSNWLPQLMKDFKQKYNSVVFELQQGEYTSIAGWIKEGSVDFGFVNPDAVSDLIYVPLKSDEMLAVLPADHHLAKNKKVNLKELSYEPFILLDEGWLPQLMKDFKQKYNSVVFELQQGEYTSIAGWIKEGSVDFGFVNPDAVSDLIYVPLKSDEMLAVLPADHHLARNKKVNLKELSNEPFILLDEGELSEPLEIFKQNQLLPNVQYRVHDDYTIMSMIEKGLGISILPKLILSRLHYQIVTKEISPPIVRTIALAYKNKNILPIASRYFIDFIVEQFHNM